MIYNLFQITIPTDFESREAQERWVRLKSQGIHGYDPKVVHRSDYQQVYSGELSKEEIQNKCIYDVLQMLFDRFNLEIPEDFKGTNMSGSDVVELVSEDGSSRFFYCASIGWDLMPNGFV